MIPRNRAHAGACIATALLTVAMLAPLGGSLPATDATFNDNEFAASGAMVAATLSPPQITGVTCSTSLLAGGTTTVTWKWPAGALYGGLSATNAQWQLTTGWQSVATTGPVSGVYTTSFNQTLLTGLITNVVGGSFTVPVRTANGSWTSGDSSSFTYTNSLLGILQAPTCSYANGA